MASLMVVRDVRSSGVAARCGAWTAGDSSPAVRVSRTTAYGGYAET